ncbi:MAG: sulfur carrier protein ThiS [Acidobacteria bacterium]|nr:MAG: sulfur carrier protein ThiS [Acidobacteriota bacterium]
MNEVLHLTVNGEPTRVPGPASVASLLRRLAYDPAGHLAVAVNKTFVPRAQHQHHPLRDGDEIDVVAPMQGG